MDSVTPPLQAMVQAPIFIDVEASGFGSRSHPLEVGIAFGAGDRYCTLIKPQPNWQHWTAEAEALHGISKALLEDRGRPAAEVAATLNSLLRGQTVFSDCWTVDYPWIRKLFYAARVELEFRVSSLEMLMSEQELMRWDDCKVAAEKAVLEEEVGRRHRASIDACILRETYIRVKALASNDPDEFVHCDSATVGVSALKAGGAQAAL